MAPHSAHEKKLLLICSFKLIVIAISAVFYSHFVLILKKWWRNFLDGTMLPEDCYFRRPILEPTFMPARDLMPDWKTEMKLVPA